MSEAARIGVLGGMGPVATADFYQRLLAAYQARFGAVQDGDYPELYIESVAFSGSNEQGIVDDGAVRDQCVEALDNLEYAGAERVLIPCVTLHSIVDTLEGATSTEIVDVVGETIERIEADDMGTIGLLASETCYEEAIYGNRNDGLEIVVPESAGRQALTEVIRQVMAGQRTAEAEATVADIADRLDRRGAEAVVLGCTELSALVRPDDLTQDVYDTMEILIETAIEA